MKPRVALLIAAPCCVGTGAAVFQEYVSTGHPEWLILTVFYWLIALACLGVFWLLHRRAQ